MAKWKIVTEAYKMTRDLVPVPDKLVEGSEENIVGYIRRGAEEIGDRWDLARVVVTATNVDNPSNSYTYKWDSPGGFRDEHGSSAASIR